MLAWLGFMLTVAIGPATLWSGETIAEDRISGVTSQGLEIRQSFDEGSIVDRAVIPWGEVRSVANAWSGAEQYRSVADALKRAEERLARGDAPGASWLLEPLAEDYFDERGTTTGQIASALVMTRVLEGRTSDAIDAWLVWRADRAGPARDWLDAATGLCPALPPVFAPETEHALVAQDRSDTEVMRAIYGVAAQVSAGDSGNGLESIPRTPRDRADLGVRYVWDMVRASTEPEASARRAAREAIDRRGRTGDADWQGAWADLGVGVSLMREPGRRLQDTGAARLIAVIVEHPRAAPGLTALARDLLVGYFERTGRPGHAEAVRGMDRAALLGLAIRSTEDDESVNDSQTTPDGAGSLENP